ncbi:MAG: DUF4173 domain-containing protein [Patescibacteria group bacterium]|nr:DUF4173 domain-containing protein [Patescibacteria group bacterium]
MNNFNENLKNNSEEISPAKPSAKRLLLCAGLAIFWVIFIWGFWQKGIYALGINYFIFLSLFGGLFFGVIYKKVKFSINDLIWLAPIFSIILSFLIYDNPFLKIISLLILPVIFAFFYNYLSLENKEARHWDFYFLFKMIKRFFSFLSKIGLAAILYIELIIPAGKNKKRIIAKVAAGILLFLIISLTVIIPLLSSADKVFSGKTEFIYSWINAHVSLIFIYKIIASIILSVLMFSMLFAWNKKFDYREKEENNYKIDPIISGIVLGGILIIYLLFLWVQVGRLWVGSLPFEFKDTEQFVKSGFWQLFCLSIINIIIYFFTYRKTILIVQRILTVFTFASLLLLISAAHRMQLYVTYYGFSYEKLFASYTVIYCVILFIWLISRLFVKNRSNIFKFVIILFVCMYGLIAIFPVEQFILRANVKLSELNGSRIKLHELTMLSPDVLQLIKRYKAEGLLKDKVYYPGSGAGESDWSAWINKKEKIIADKKWYERNLMNYIYLKNN